MSESEIWTEIAAGWTQPEAMGWGIDDAAQALADEPMEYWACDAQSWLDALPDRDDRWLLVWCTRRVNDGAGPAGPSDLPAFWFGSPGRPDRPPHRWQRPTARQLGDYARGFRAAMQAGIAVCEAGYSDGDDPEEVLARAIEAAEDVRPR